jgi:hypothetical protein
MTISEIYNWLLKTDPTEESVDVRHVWADMASYCYFVNTMDFDRIYQSRLKQVLKRGMEFGINLPTDDHSKVLEIAKEMDQTNLKTYINTCTYDEPQTAN